MDILEMMADIISDFKTSGVRGKRDAILKMDQLYKTSKHRNDPIIKNAYATYLKKYRFPFVKSLKNEVVSMKKQINKPEEPLDTSGLHPEAIKLIQSESKKAKVDPLPKENLNMFKNILLEVEEPEAVV